MRRTIGMLALLVAALAFTLPRQTQAAGGPVLEQQAIPAVAMSPPATTAHIDLPAPATTQAVAPTTHVIAEPAASLAFPAAPATAQREHDRWRSAGLGARTARWVDYLASIPRPGPRLST